MYLGVRKVRSAGRNSGSVEVTLPVQLSVLEGVECRLMLRDSPRPELVLELELADVHAFFREMWGKTALGLAEADDVGDFSTGDFVLALFGSPRAPDRPLLTYSDGLIAMRSQPTSLSETLREPGPSDLDPGSEAVSRVIGALGAAAGYRLGLTRAFAQGFGDALGYLVTGSASGPGADFERGTAHQAFMEGRGSVALPVGAIPFLSPFEDRTWQMAQSGLARVFEQYQRWQADPALYQAARDRWYVALTLEMGVGASVYESITSSRRAS